MYDFGLNHSMIEARSEIPGWGKHRSRAARPQCSTSLDRSAPHRAKQDTVHPEQNSSSAFLAQLDAADSFVFV